jgi:hypothetical protein
MDDRLLPSQSTTQVPTQARTVPPPEGSVGSEAPGDVTPTRGQFQNPSTQATQVPGSPLKRKTPPAKPKKPTKKNANQIHRMLKTDAPKDSKGIQVRFFHN